MQIGNVYIIVFILAFCSFATAQVTSCYVNTAGGVATQTALNGTNNNVCYYAQFNCSQSTTATNYNCTNAQIAAGTLITVYSYFNGSATNCTNIASTAGVLNAACCNVTDCNVPLVPQPVPQPAPQPEGTPQPQPQPSESPESAPQPEVTPTPTPVNVLPNVASCYYTVPYNYTVIQYAVTNDDIYDCGRANLACNTDDAFVGIYCTTDQVQNSAVIPIFFVYPRNSTTAASCSDFANRTGFSNVYCCATNNCNVPLGSPTPTPTPSPRGASSSMTVLISLVLAALFAVILV